MLRFDLIEGTKTIVIKEKNETKFILEYYVVDGMPCLALTVLDRPYLKLPSSDADMMYTGCKYRKIIVDANGKKININSKTAVSLVTRIGFNLDEVILEVITHTNSKLVGYEMSENLEIKTKDSKRETIVKETLMLISGIEYIIADSELLVDLLNKGLAVRLEAGALERYGLMPFMQLLEHDRETGELEIVKYKSKRRITFGRKNRN